MRELQLFALPLVQANSGNAAVVIPAQAGIQGAFVYKDERRREPYLSGFRLSPELRCWYSGVFLHDSVRIHAAWPRYMFMPSEPNERVPSRTATENTVLHNGWA